MNFINRVIIIFELVVALVGSLALIAGLLFFRSILRNTLEPTFRQLLDANIQPVQLLCIGLLTVLAAIAVLLLLAQFLSPAKTYLRVESVQGAEVTITSDALVQRLEYDIDSLPDVIKVRPRVSTAGKNKPVDVTMELLIAPEADIALKTQEVMSVARRVIEEKLGLKAGNIQVRLDQAKPRVPPIKKV